jgi:hypothetical protein
MLLGGYGELRQRLQKSNMAIASLLDKSTQTEMQATSLKAKLEVMKRAKEEETAAHKKELQDNKNQAILQALQLAVNPQKSPPKKANNRVAYDDDEGDGDAGGQHVFSASGNSSVGMQALPI